MATPPDVQELQDRKREIETLRDAAKHLTTVTSALPGVYFVVLSVSELRKVIQGPVILLFLLPAILWLISLGFLIAIILPRKVTIESAGDTQLAITRKMVSSYSSFLVWAVICFAVGMLLVMINLAIYFLV